MMIHIFKKKTIVLDCFTDIEAVALTAPIAEAVKHFPEWWKSLPNEYTVANKFYNSSTMKRCEGMKAYYTNSLAVPMWTDLAISVTDGGAYEWQFANRISTAGIHDPKQRGSYLNENEYGHIKLNTPWLLRTKEDLNWVFSSPTYSFEKPEELIIPPGILNFGEQFSVNINILFIIRTPRVYNIPFGLPMAHLTPMSDRPVIVKRHVISPQEYQNILRKDARIAFTAGYKKYLTAKDKFSNCPYSGGFK